MSKPALLALLLFSALIAPRPALADSRLGESCDLAIFGVKDKSGFLRFDAALRSALERQDADTLAPLVQFPLRLNRADGSHAMLVDAAALRQQFATAFPPSVHKSVLEQKPDALFCNADGVMYGNGELWADLAGTGEASQFRITAIHPPSAENVPESAEPAAKTELSCNTDKFRIVVDGGSAPRYRSWNKPHAPPDKPAMELAGKVDREGTGACSHRIWHFKNRNVEYVLSEPGCGDGSEPADAKARLEIRIGNRPPQTSWCY